MTEHHPVALVLTRQDLPLYEKSGKDALKGGYILSDSEKATPDCLLMASGSEVEQCVEAQAALKAEGHRRPRHLHAFLRAVRCSERGIQGIRYAQSRACPRGRGSRRYLRLA